MLKNIWPFLIAASFFCPTLFAAGKPERNVHHYLAHVLKVEEPERFLITDKIRTELELGFSESSEKAFNADRTLTPAGRAALLTQFSDVSAEGVAEMFLTLGRPRYSNTMLIGPAGVGKSFLINQFAIMLAFGVVPGYLDDALGTKDANATFLASLRKSYFENTQFVTIDYDLLSQDNTRSGAAFAKADVRMRSLLIDIFNAAKKDFRASGLRTVFVMEEVATLPPLVQSTLKILLDGTGFRTATDTAVQRGSEVGYSVIGITTPGEYEEMVDGDSATERRYKKRKILEPDDEKALGILTLQRDSWSERTGLQISDEVLAYIISMRKFFSNPPLAMPDSVLQVVNDLLLWAQNANNRKHGTEITIDEAYDFLIRHNNLPLATWLPADPEKAPLWDLAARVKQHVVKQDAAIDRIARRVKTGRATGFREVQVFFIMGPSGSGKDTIAKAFNQEMFGHNGHHLKFELAGERGTGLRTVLEKSADDGLPLLLKAMGNGQPNGFIVLNEAKDMPSEQFDALKTIIEDGIIRPRGSDTRERPLGLNVIFIMGQYGEELFEGLTDEEAREKAANVTDKELVEILQRGSDHGTKGAVPYAVIQRAVRNGGLILLPPVPTSGYPEIVRNNLKEIIKNFKVRSNLQVTVDETLVNFVSDLALKNDLKTRGLDGILKDLTETAISEANDQKLPMRGIALNLRVADGSNIVVDHLDSDGVTVKKSYTFAAASLLRAKCDSLLLLTPSKTK